MPSGEKLSAKDGPRAPAGLPVKFGPFWLEARLAVGGTAEVFIARPIDPMATPRRLVVKRLLPQYVKDPEGRTMFEREAALHAAVRHENVVKVYGYGTVGDEPWLAMEFIDGCDLFRLLRRLAGDGRALGPGVSAYVAREILSALDSVHTARDPAGTPLGIIHRDVTPSNVYLSSSGRVMLGDFGIARAASRATMRTGGAAMLKGKFAYLSPEQVAGDAFDHRSDLFSLAAVLTEMLLGHPLFAGSGQLAVLLAIRDCRIDTLRDARATLPDGLFEVLERALSQNPSARLQTAEALSNALKPFDTNVSASVAELGALVRWVRAAPSTEKIQAVRDSAAKLRARAAAASNAAAEAAEVHAEAPAGAKSESERPTGEYVAIPSFVMNAGGVRLGPWTFARLVEAIATGQVGRADSVDYMGRGLAPLQSIEELVRFLPGNPASLDRGESGASTELVDRVSPSALLEMLARFVETDATGVLFAEGPPESSGFSRIGDPVQEGRKELYFVGGRLHHIASNNAGELLGEYLVRRGIISREELDFALAVLARYDGRMGDTLIALGLVDSLGIFRAIRDQGKDRLVDLFQWHSGRLTFYPGQTATHVEFPLELDVPPLLLAGVEAATPGEAPLTRWRDRFGDTIGPASLGSPKLRAAPWPKAVRRLLDIVTRAMPLRDVLSLAAQEKGTTANDALRAVEVLIGVKLLRWHQANQPSA